MWLSAWRLGRPAGLLSAASCPQAGTEGVLMLEGPAMGTGGMMARISYVDPDSVTDPELAGYLSDAREHGTPRLESQAVRAHVPAVLRTFSQSWQQVFRDGVLDHRVKELARVFIAKSLECGYCAAQRSDLGAAQGLTEVPPIIQLVRKPGTGGTSLKPYANVGAAVNVIGLTSVTGLPETWLVEAHYSFASVEELDQKISALSPVRALSDSYDPLAG